MKNNKPDINNDIELPENQDEIIFSIPLSSKLILPGEEMKSKYVISQVLVMKKHKSNKDIYQDDLQAI